MLSTVAAMTGASLVMMSVEVAVLPAASRAVTVIGLVV